MAWFGATVPEELCVIDPPTTDEVAQQYADWLDDCRPLAARRFRQRFKDARDDALVEAVTWWMLAGYFRYVVTSGEGDGGGPDFDCGDDHHPLLFTVEATAFRSEALSRVADLPPEPVDFAGALGDVSQALFDRVERKVRQAKERSGSVLVVLGSTHWCHNMVLDRWAAEGLIAGRRKLSVPVGKPATEIETVTAFEGSAFLRLQEHFGIEAARKALAGVLLLGINARGCCVIGSLNPWATYPFDPALLPGIPLCTASLTPDQEVLNLSWVVGSPSPARLEFVRVPPPRSPRRP